MKTMNHAEYQRRLKNKSILELEYILQDANETLKANPYGENAGFYADEIHYAAAELRRRIQANNS